MSNSGNTSSDDKFKTVSKQEEYDREQLNETAKRLHNIASKLSRQSAIDNSLSKALHDCAGDIHDSLPHELMVNTEIKEKYGDE